MKVSLCVALVTFLIFYRLTTVTSDPCPFNANCDCNLTLHLVQCRNAQTFPTFTQFNESAILMIIINGNFTSIPAKALYPLQSLYAANVYIQRDAQYPNLPMTIDDNAFVTFFKYAISLLEFDIVPFDTIPTAAFSHLTLDQLSITYGTLENVTSGAFDGFTTGEVAIYDNKVKFIDPNAFDGLQVGGTNGLTLFFGYNYLTEISTAFKKANATVVYLFYNQITQVPDYAFSSCNTPSGCTNVLTNVYLSNNPIVSVGANAFQNLPNVREIDLSQTSLTTIPVNALQPVGKTIQIVDFTYDQITTVEANSFYGFPKLTSVVLDWNPIVTIEAGAFNGVQIMEPLSFTGLLQLTTVDVLVTYGMGSVKYLEFKYCPKLSTLTLSDATKVPSTLQSISLSTGNDLDSVDPNLQKWLQGNSNRTLDVSNNPNFICDSTIGWMANFVLCPPIQILATNTMCANNNQTLSNYLTNFQSCS